MIGGVVEEQQKPQATSAVHQGSRYNDLLIHPTNKTKKQEKLQSRIEDLDCWNLEHRVDTVMGALHLPPTDARTCVGCWLKQINRLLVNETHVISKYTHQPSRRCRGGSGAAWRCAGCSWSSRTCCC